MQRREQFETADGRIRLSDIRKTLERDFRDVESVTIIVHPSTLCKWDGIIWDTEKRGLYKCNNTIIHLILVDSQPITQINFRNDALSELHKCDNAVEAPEFTDPELLATLDRIWNSSIYRKL